MAGSSATSKGDEGFVRHLLNYDPVRFKFTNNLNDYNGVQIKEVIHMAVRREDATSLAKVKEKILERRTVKGYTSQPGPHGEWVDIPKSEVSLILFDIAERLIETRFGLGERQSARLACARSRVRIPAMVTSIFRDM